MSGALYHEVLETELNRECVGSSRLGWGREREGESREGDEARKGRENARARGLHVAIPGKRSGVRES